MTILPKDHVHVKYSVHRDVLAAFDEIIEKHGNGITRSWLIRQFIQEWVTDQASLLPNDIRTRILSVIDDARGK